MSNAQPVMVNIEGTEFDLATFDNEQRLMLDRINFSQAAVDVNSTAKSVLVQSLLESLQVETNEPVEITPPNLVG